MWDDDGDAFDDGAGGAAPRSSSVADAIATGGIYPLVAYGDTGDGEDSEDAVEEDDGDERGVFSAVAALDSFRPTSSPRQEARRRHVHLTSTTVISVAPHFLFKHSSVARASVSRHQRLPEIKKNQ